MHAHTHVHTHTHTHESLSTCSISQSLWSLKSECTTSHIVLVDSNQSRTSKTLKIAWRTTFRRQTDRQTDRCGNFHISFFFHAHLRDSGTSLTLWWWVLLIMSVCVSVCVRACLCVLNWKVAGRKSAAHERLHSAVLPDRRNPRISKMSPFHSGSTASSLEHHAGFTQTVEAEMVLKDQCYVDNTVHHLRWSCSLDLELWSLVWCYFRPSHPNRPFFSRLFVNQVSISSVGRKLSWHFLKKETKLPHKTWSLHTEVPNWVLPRVLLMPPFYLNSNTPSGSADSRVPIVISTSITGTGAHRSTAHFQVSLETRICLTVQSKPNRFLGFFQWASELSFHVSILPNLPGQAMSNDNGVWANLFCCVISSIIPSIEGPGVINKQNSKWWCRFIVERGGGWLRGSQ